MCARTIASRSFTTRELSKNVVSPAFASTCGTPSTENSYSSGFPMRIGESTSVSSSGAQYVCGAVVFGVGRTAGSSALIERVHPEAGTIDTSCGRLGSAARVRNVGAPFTKAKSDSIQLVRTDISRP